MMRIIHTKKAGWGHGFCATSDLPTTHLPVMARVLKLSTDELLGTTAVKQRASRGGDSRLQRRLQQIEKLDVPERRQILQLIDTFIEHGQLRRKTHNKQASK
jgi:hypothetical protein